ncbi:MAG: hypothetical protein EOS22_03305 [Mesorhizobium sp.]|uniref:hypothetical protein n=1 Tax=Mesorhizobium sp. TaxID=1871066 RepID=UPI000FEA69EC|nr:hypothetical protein [Mesorhizobium sp.]RWD32042.1 MAG: hypothetical protein EOS22_03305 [Mesorhizobium sp.]
MQNTIKIPTIAWGIAALVFFPFFVPNSYNISLFGIRFLPAILFAYVAYRTYKNGLPAGASPEERATARHQAFAAVVLSLISVTLGIGFGLIRPPNFKSVMPSVAGIEGKYRDPNGSTVEFLGDGTAVIVMHGQQAIWKWSSYEGNRLKLEPDSGMIGVSSAMCDYQLNGSNLRVTGCEYAMQLTRF